MIIEKMEDLLMKSFLLFKSRWKNISLTGAFFYGIYLFLLVVPLVIVFGVMGLDPSAMDSATPPLAMMIFSVVYFFIIVIFTFLVFFMNLIIYDQLMCSREGIHRNVIQSFLKTLPQYLPYMGTSYVASFIVFPVILPGLVVFAVTSYGFVEGNILLIIPFFISALVYMVSIYLGTAFTSLAQTAAVYEKQDVQTNLKKAFGILKNSFWRWIGRYMLFQLIMGVAIGFSYIFLVPFITGITLLNMPEVPFSRISLWLRIAGTGVGALISFVFLLAVLVLQTGMLQSFNLLHYQDLKARSSK